MQYEGDVYRPPSEARSLIIQVTIGCSHNKCTFCHMYTDKQFRVRKREEILADLDECRDTYGPYVQRAFFADGDALVLPVQSLLHILKSCYAAFPALTRVGAYATVADLDRKTPEELKALKEAGLKIVYVGIESGSDKVLRYVEKGETKEQTVRACRKALTAGMKLSAMILLGLGGQSLSKEHAEETADVISAVNPTMLSALTLMIPDDAPLKKDVDNGGFVPLTARGFLEELYLILKNITVTEPCIFRSNHVSNLFALAGTLPEDKAKMLTSVKPYIQRLNDTLPLRNNTGNF